MSKTEWMKNYSNKEDVDV